MPRTKPSRWSVEGISSYLRSPIGECCGCWGTLAFRRVIEEVEIRDAVKHTRKVLRAARSDGTNPSRKEIWEVVLSHPTDVVLCLAKLSKQGLPAGGSDDRRHLQLYVKERVYRTAGRCLP